MAGGAAAHGMDLGRTRIRRRHGIWRCYVAAGVAIMATAAAWFCQNTGGGMIRRPMHIPVTAVGDVTIITVLGRAAAPLARINNVATGNNCRTWVAIN